jgi:hypothetical protein
MSHRARTALLCMSVLLAGVQLCGRGWLRVCKAAATK